MSFMDGYSLHISVRDTQHYSNSGRIVLMTIPQSRYDSTGRASTGRTARKAAVRVTAYPATPSTIIKLISVVRSEEIMDSQNPVNFSKGVWKYTDVVYVAKNSRVMMAKVATMAHLCGCDQAVSGRPPVACNRRKEYDTCSVRKSTDMVSRNRWPDTSWPLRSLGTSCQLSSGGVSDVWKSSGCVESDIVDLR
jgi:hypothetical protein